jgi:lantibiotic biosynthesis protein
MYFKGVSRTGIAAILGLRFFAMKHPRLRAAGFFVVRSPLLSSQTFLGDRSQTLEQRVDALKTLCKAGPIAEALHASSPSLAKALTQTQMLTLTLSGDAETPVGENSISYGDPLSIAAACMRYVERMRGRATPFGLCAGYSMGTFGKTTMLLKLTPLEDYDRIARIDLDVVNSVVRTHLVEDENRRRKGTFRATRDLIVFPDMLKVARRAPDGTVSYADINRSDALMHVLNFSQEAVSFAAVVAEVLSFASTNEEAVAYVEQTIAEGLLVSSESPALTCNVELDALASLPEFGLAVENARRIRVAKMSSEPLTSAFAQIEKALAPFSGDTKEIVIFDLKKSLVSGQLGEDLIRELGLMVAVLQRVSEGAQDQRFRKFREFLTEHYEGREVPLVEALDPERGFDFPIEADYERKANAGLETWRNRLYARALVAGSREIVLTESDLPKTDRFELRGAFSAHFKLALTASGPSIHELAIVRKPGTAYFARATAFFPELRKATEAYLAEQGALEPDADIAEVAYFVPGKSAAFVQYPCLQPCEIALTTSAGVEEARRIDVNDLLVSARGSQIVLRSKKTGRRVIPRNTGAANPDRPVVTGLARFLFRLASTEQTSGSFHWGSVGAGAFLPRLRFGNHVLSAMQWSLDAATTKPLREAKSKDQAWEAVQALRASLALPRHVVYHEMADHLLPVDFDDRLSVHAWLDIAKEAMTLSESFPVQDSCVSGPEGAFHHELVVPLFGPPEEKPKPILAVAPVHADAVTFDKVLPGQGVLYLKLYGDRASLTSLVTETARDSIIDLMEQKAITHWFYLSYSDPSPHLRLRFFGEPAVLMRDVLPQMLALFKGLVATRALRTVVIDTYDRETYRYGGPVGMDLAEQAFWASSEASVGFHDENPTKEYNEKAVLRAAVQQHIAMLSCAGMSVDEARLQAKRTAERYQRAFDPMVPKRRAGDLFRADKEALLAAVDADQLFSEPIAARFRQVFATFKAKQSTIFVPFDAWLSDVMHVHSIRLFTVWAETPGIEEIAYLVLEKTLAGQKHHALVSS